jgi:hypothetical protein
LLLAGHTVPGYYVLGIPGGENYKVVFCNFPVGPSNGQFQVDTEVKLAASPKKVGSTNYKIGHGRMCKYVCCLKDPVVDEGHIKRYINKSS